MNSLGCGHVWSDDVHRHRVAYRKIFRYVFKLSWRVSITELLNIFGVQSVGCLLELKRNRLLNKNLSSNFIELRFLTKDLREI